MGFDILLNLLVDQPIAAAACLLVGGGILFGLIGGMTGIEFFLEHWYKLIVVGVVVLILGILLDFVKEKL